MDTKIIPLPVWATDPNEGNTWGVMPVIMRVCRDDRTTAWMLAPSVTWNSIVRLTGTLRWYIYPSEDSNILVQASASTRIQFNFLVLWKQLPPAVGAWTQELTVRFQRDPFARFFGIGPDTSEDAETSYTAVRALIAERAGVNLAEHVNLALTLGAEHDGVDAIGVKGLPLAPEVFPDTPGMAGATLLAQGIDLRYDSRPNNGLTDHGVRIDAWVAYVEGVENSPSFLRTGVEASALWRELDWLGGAARGYWNRVGSGEAPFYQQSSLGGPFLLRGFAGGRFVDRQAWTAELEQRIRLLRTHFLGVDADWRVDPFVAVGQVFGDARDAFSHPRVSAGFGLRAFVQPNVLGRIDLADGGDGIEVYVELGYPY